MEPALKKQIESLVTALTPIDTLGQEHQVATLSWMHETDDILRRVKPRTSPPHLVSYFLVIDRAARSVLLCDHRLAGLWLPTGRHVEPGEHPRATVQRKASEELGIVAEYDRLLGDQPFFLTTTETVGNPALRHVDVSLWFSLEGRVGQTVTPDEGEFRKVQWWSISELSDADASRFEPHLCRAASALAPEL
jgi:8-oxo-dGTP diphosphatase